MTPCMYFYKAKIQSDGSLDKLNLRILVRGDLQNKELVEDTWSPTASMRNLKYFLADATTHKTRVHQLDLIGAFLQTKVKNRVFVKLDIRYTDYFPEYAKYFRRALIWSKSTTRRSSDLPTVVGRSEFPNWRSKWSWTCNSMHGCVQGKNSIWWKSWQVKIKNCGYRRSAE